MATSDTFQCSIITPERKVLECDATFVAFPAYDGEMGVLTRRAPLVCKLGIGPLRIETATTSRDREGAVPTPDDPYRPPAADQGAGPHDPYRDRKGAAGKYVFFIDGGFAQVVDNRLTILTEQARKAEDLDAAAAQQALIEARAIRITDDASYTARAKAIRRAQVQLKLAQLPHPRA